jgi:hypothetical protein
MYVMRPRKHENTNAFYIPPTSSNTEGTDTNGVSQRFVSPVVHTSPLSHAPGMKASNGERIKVLESGEQLS